MEYLDSFWVYFSVTTFIEVIIGIAMASKYGKNSWQAHSVNGVAFAADAIIAFAIGASFADSYYYEDVYTMYVVVAVICLIVGIVSFAIAATKKKEADEEEEIPSRIPYSGPQMRARAEVIEVRTGKTGFRLDNGQMMLLNTYVNNYRVGETGMLIWQGNRVVSFDRMQAPAMQPGRPVAPVQPGQSGTSMQLIRCPKCNTQQKAGRRICFQCGYTFTPEESNPKPAAPETAQQPAAQPAAQGVNNFCIACGAKILPEMKFCAGCGKPLTPPEPVVFCHNCGTKQTYGDGKCTSCGTQLIKRD